jgi:D-sedoheptulose 7-phosphate isomerase
MPAARGATQADLDAVARASLEESLRVKRATLDVCIPTIAEAGEFLIEAFRGGAKVLCFGNGGSAADAQHFASELAGRFHRERRPLPALALTANSSDLTGIGNDYGFERVFERLIEAHGRRGDVAFAISTSGNSANVNAAVIEGGKRGLRTIALTGRVGGKLADLAELVIRVPSEETPRIQEAHTAICHVLCELVDSVLFPDAFSS